jgi:hypothetical protein
MDVSTNDVTSGVNDDVALIFFEVVRIFNRFRGGVTDLYIVASIGCKFRVFSKFIILQS